MKRILFLLTLIFAFTSCSDFLEVKSQSTFSDDVVFSEPTLAEGYIYGIYNIIGGNNSYRNRLGLYMGNNSDCEYRSGASSDKKTAVSDAREYIALFTADVNLGNGFNNTGDDNPWSYLYQALESCNLAIANIRKYGNPQPGNKMGFLLGEALTLRAFFFNDLIKWWGDVPARFVPVTADNLYIPKTPRTEIYTQIIADLGEAATLVPWNGPGDVGGVATVQRVTKGFVKALRARICMAAAGKAMLPDASGAKIDYVFADESTRREYYSIAKQECADIIGAGKYHLETDFTQVFKDQCRYVTSVGRESIFELPYNSGKRGQMYYFFGLAWANDGKYVNNSQSASGIGGSLNVVPSFFYDYNDNDVRKLATVAPYTMKVVSSVLQPEITNVTDFKLAKWRADYQSGHILDNNDDGMGLMIIRYADVLLMYAEADLYLGAPDGATYLNMIRRRAFNGSTAYDLSLTLDNIKQERAFEFCGEHIRKFDLIRWGELGTTLKKCQNRMRDIKSQTGVYTDVPQNIYYRLKDVAGKTNEKYMEIYGLKRGEFDDKTVTDPTGNWVKVKWTNGTVTVSNVTYDRISDTWVDNFLFHQDPDKRQLLPITQVILNSNSLLKNDYGY